MVLNLAACQSKKKHANNIRNVATTNPRRQWNGLRHIGLNRGIVRFVTASSGGWGKPWNSENTIGAGSDGAGEGRIVNSNLQGLQGLSQQKAAFSTSVKIPKEEAIPVRTTDLKHLKRDIRRIPDGNGKLDNAFWCAIGIGIPMIIQFVVDSSSSGGHGNWLILAIGVVSCILAGMFKIFGKGEKEERERYIDGIIENIDDFSVGVR